MANPRNPSTTASHLFPPCAAGKVAAFGDGECRDMHCRMDLALMALADLVEVLIRCVDDRYGRAMAWISAAVGCAILLALPVLIFLRLVR